MLRDSLSFRLALAFRQYNFQLQKITEILDLIDVNSSLTHSVERSYLPHDSSNRKDRGQDPVQALRVGRG